MQLELSNHYHRTKVISKLQEDINSFCIKEFSEEIRTHLGASVIGEACSAKIWNAWRWLKFESFDGRMHRLFNRGHLEEARFVRWLVGIGFEVFELDPETQKQFRISGSNGHFGGSLDAMLKFPESYNIQNNIMFLGEFKTHNENSFTKLAGKLNKGTNLRENATGVQLAKPQHYRQMCSYGRCYNFNYGLYCAVNKDTDELYFEIVELDFAQADDLFRKADQIINSQERPQKIAQSETFFDCRYCTFKDMCHGDEVPIVNCRSCKFAFPVENAQWRCGHWDGIIPKEEIIKGCSSWERIA